MFEAEGHGLDALFGERQAIDHGRFEAVGAGFFEVALVGGGERSLAGADFGSHGQQGLVLGVGGGSRYGAGSGASLAADGLHVGLDVHLVSLWVVGCGFSAAPGAGLLSRG